MAVVLPSLQRRRGLAALAVWLGLPAGAAVAADAPLRIGLSPFLSPAALLQAFRPIREHLERSLARAVEMVTAKDFAALVEATRRGDYDVALLPAHIASLAVTDWRFQPLAGVDEPVLVQVYVRATGPIQKPSDLSGGKVGMLDAFALTAAVGRQWLQEQGLGTAVSISALPSVNSAMIALDRGEVEAVVANNSQLLSLPPSTPRTERLLATVGNIPGPTYVAHPRLGTAEAERVRSALLAFRPDPSRPATTTNAVLQAVGAERFARLEPYAEQVRRALAQRP